MLSAPRESETREMPIRSLSFIDFPERVWLFLLYFIRSIVYSIWAIVAFIGEYISVSYEDPKYNWIWLGIQVMIVWIGLSYELISFLRDLKKRALKDELQKINVTITSIDGKKYEFTLPKEERIQYSVFIV